MSGSTISTTMNYQTGSVIGSKNAHQGKTVFRRGCQISVSITDRAMKRKLVESSTWGQQKIFILCITNDFRFPSNMAANMGVGGRKFKIDVFLQC